MNQTDRRPFPITTEMSGKIPSFSGEDPNTFTEEEMINTLNGLIETCRDGQKGFVEAAEGAQRSDIKELFHEFAAQRASYVPDLQSLVQTLGGDPEDEGSFSGAIHRGWINIKSAVMGRDDSAILNEAERGEDIAKSTYESAVKMPFPSYILDTLETQYMEIRQAHDQVKALRNAADSSGEQSSTARTGF